MAYRNDVDALAARLKDLEDQVGDRTRERDEVAALLAEARTHESAERGVAEAPLRKQRQRTIMIAVLAALGVIVGVFVAVRARRSERADSADAMAKMREFTDQMCRCHDRACAEKVSDAMIRWSQEKVKTEPVPRKWTEEEQRDAVAIGRKMGECMQRAMTPPAEVRDGVPQ